MRSEKRESCIVAAISGGPDSVFLLERIIRQTEKKIVAAHVNHALRGKESDKDAKFVEELAKRRGVDFKTAKIPLDDANAAIEEKARKARFDFLEKVRRETNGILATGHTADDQVETILMRFFEGAGISGLKGIPTDLKHGPLRPIINEWKEDIVEYLNKNFISFRVDRSNRDPRFERNWIRNTLLPLLEKKYGKGVKKRIFVMGERFRELDEYLNSEASRWIRGHVRKKPETARFRRKPYAGLPVVLRIRILQKICFKHLDCSPNERLLASMDKTVCLGKPSGKVDVGGGWKLLNQYEDVCFTASGKTAHGKIGEIQIKDAGKMTPTRARRIALRGNAEVFDSEGVRLPLTVRPLRRGDRILPFGATGEKKLKEIMIDRKIPGDKRWGRPVVCDSAGAILWAPGLIRSGHAPVTASTRCAKIICYSAHPEERVAGEPV